VQAVELAIRQQVTLLCDLLVLFCLCLLLVRAVFHAGEPGVGHYHSSYTAPVEINAVCAAHEDDDSTTRLLVVGLIALSLAFGRIERSAQECNERDEAELRRDENVVLAQLRRRSKLLDAVADCCGR
jgi:hypothetical protein